MSRQKPKVEELSLIELDGAVALGWSDGVDSDVLDWDQDLAAQVVESLVPYTSPSGEVPPKVAPWMRDIAEGRTPRGADGREMPDAAAGIRRGRNA